MAEQLKDGNKLRLTLVLGANLLAYLAVVRGEHLVTSDWSRMAADLTELLPAGIATAASGLLNSLLSGEAKARLVFWRWNDPLPGSEAFTRYMKADPRVDAPRLQERFGPFPSDRKKQNALWYKWYRTLTDDPGVIHAHREYLFYRDFTSLAMMLAVALAPLAMILAPSGKLAAAYFVCLILQFLAASRAARVHGRRMVGTVLSIKAAEA